MLMENYARVESLEVVIDTTSVTKIGVSQWLQPFRFVELNSAHKFKQQQFLGAMDKNRGGGRHCGRSEKLVRRSIVVRSS